MVWQCKGAVWPEATADTVAGNMSLPLTTPVKTAATPGHWDHITCNVELS